VPEGSSSANFTAHTTRVTSETQVTVEAYLNGKVTATLTVTPQVFISDITLSLRSVLGGDSLTGAVTLEGPAPRGGVTAILESSKPAVLQVPASVPVPAGSRTVAFTATTSRVTTPTSVTISGMLDWEVNGGWFGAYVWVNPPPPSVSGLVFSPSPVVGGNSATGTVTLSGPALGGGSTLAVVSSNPAVVQVPASVTVPTGGTSTTFTATTSSVTAQAQVQVRAVLNGSVQATLRVDPASPAVPGPFSLSSPGNGVSEVPLAPTLTQLPQPRPKNRRF